jgi:hypothetical protein
MQRPDLAPFVATPAVQTPCSRRPRQRGKAHPAAMNSILRRRMASAARRLRLVAGQHMCGSSQCARAGGAFCLESCHRNPLQHLLLFHERVSKD